MTIPDLHNVGSITEVTTGVTLRGDTLRRRIAARAFVLGDTGIGAGDRVLIAHGGTAAFFVDLMAAWQCGAMAICVNPDVTDAELARVAAFSRASAVITASAAVAPRGFRRIAPPDDAEANVSNASGISPLRPDDPALVLFTSGTTADPKGVVHSAGSLFHRIGENVRQIPDGALARSLCVLPTHFGRARSGARRSRCCRAGARARHRRPRSSLVWTRPGAVRTARAKGRFRAVWRGVCGATSARAAQRSER